MQCAHPLRTVEIADEVGFCFGVRRAVHLTEQALEVGDPVYILGDVVHNRTVTDTLEARGLRKVRAIADRPVGTMVVRAHGLPRDEMADARDRGFRIVDATCPIVHRAQEAARTLEERGCQVVIVGDAEHAEIKGILGALSKPAIVVDSVEGLRQAKDNHSLRRKVGVIFQTTHALELCRDLIGELVFMCKEVQIVNTICKPVQNRQDDALDLASRVDLMVIVGSITSANTVELAALCRSHNPWTLQIETADDLMAEAYVWARRVGIASGLSTPVAVVERVRDVICGCPEPPDAALRPPASFYADTRHAG